jgi:hypothetical protein
MRLSLAFSDWKWSGAHIDGDDAILLSKPAKIDLRYNSNSPQFHRRNPPHSAPATCFRPISSLYSFNDE